MARIAGLRYPVEQRLHVLFSQFLSVHLGLLPSLQEPSQWPQIEVQVFLLQSEALPQLLHPLLEQHERLAEALHLVVRERAALDPPQRLALHELTQELHQGEHELSQPSFHVVPVRLHPPAKRRVEPVEAAVGGLKVVPVAGQHLVWRGCAHRSPSSTKLYGGHGPVHTIEIGRPSSSSDTRSRNDSTWERSTR